MILNPFIKENSEIVDIDNYTIGTVTENKSETIVGMGKGEYLTAKSNNNREYITTREDTVYIIKGMRKCYGSKERRTKTNL